MNNAGIIRNNAKIKGAIENARQFLKITESGGSFSDLFWKFTGHKTLVNHVTDLSQIKSTSKESDAMSIELKKMGFKFVGSTVCYAHMQATGIVNDHVTSCFRFAELYTP
jgi:DNA-3-methyladenine glycosylase I